MALANITNNILTDTGVNVSSLTPTSTTISTTAPLQGGGDLSANRTLSITQSGTSANGFLSSTDWNTFNNKQAAGNYMTSLTGEATGTGPGATAVTLNNASVTAKVLTGVNITGGTVVATDSILTAFGKLQNQINGLIGSSIYQGVWNAATNTPTLQSGVGVRGYYYIVNVAGTTNLDGITDWFVGDWAIFDGTAWQQVDNTDAVVSVNGQTGAVSLTTDNIPEGATNQYFLNSRARAALSFAAGSGAYNSTTGVITIPTNTSQLTNGANFITLASLSGTAPIQYNSSTGAISITQSGTSSNGFLSSTDWNTFNNKQSALTNPVTGTGTTNYIPKFTGASTIGNSQLFDNGTNVGIGTASPSVKLQVVGDGSFSGFVNANVYNLAGLTGGGALSWTTNTLRVGQDSYFQNLQFWTNGSTRMLLDASGNLGLGVTPSAWSSGGGNLQLKSGVNISWSGQDGYLAANQYYNGTNSIYISNGFATQYAQETGVHKWLTAPSGTAGGAISWTQAMTLDASGRLGIGTTSPLYRLDVQASAGVAIRVRNTFNTDDAYFLAQTTLGSALFGINATGQYLYTSDAIPTLFYNSGTERMRITAAGNVGIGTTSPSQKLTIGGGSDAYMNFAPTSYRNFIIGSDVLGYILYDNNASAYRMVVNSSGNVGIGTTSPDAKLSIVGASNTPTSFGTLLLKNSSETGISFGSSSTSYAWIQGNIYGSSYNLNLALNAQGGNVGIGTVSPIAKLTVLGTGSYNVLNETLASDAVIWSSEMTNDQYNSILQLVSVRQSLTTGSASNGFLGFSTVDDSNAQGIRDAGRIAIVNESPSARNSATALSFWTNAGGTNTTAATEKVRITSGGNVGIGTTNPTYKLDVVGSFSFTTGGNYLQYNSGILYHGNYYQYPSGNDYLLFARTSGALLFGSNDTERMRIFSGGNVAVGTSTDYGYKFVANGEISSVTPSGTKAIVSIFQVGWNKWNFQMPANSTDLQIDENGSPRITVKSGGNVGIGTTSPSYKLQSNASSYQLALINPGYGGWLYNVGTDLSMGFVLEGTGEKMRLTSSGDLLIGDTTPSANLWVKSSASGNTFGARNTNATFAATVGFFGADRNTTNNSFYYIDCYNYGSSSYRFRVSDSGNVTSAGSFLGGGNIELINAGGPYVLVGEGTGVNQYGVIDWDATNNRLRIATQPYAFGANGGQITLTTSGNVGIGTTSPGVTLDVSGSGIRITNATPNVYFNNNVVQWKAYMPTSTNNFAFSDAVRDVLTLGYNGAASYFNGCNVGIGTTTPTNRLDVSVSNKSTIVSTTSGINVNYSGSTTGQFQTIGFSWDSSISTRDSYWGMGFTGTNYSSGTGDLFFFIGGTERMRISGSNVGIGNTNPLTKLHVNNAVSGAILPYIEGTGLSYNNEGISVAGSNTNNTNIGNGLTLYNNVASVGAYGPVVAWSSQTVGGSYNSTYAFITGVYAGAGGDNNWATGSLIFGTAQAYGATERMRITAAGNVGIGTTAPSYKLQVNGSDAGLYVMAASVAPFTQTIATFIYGGNNNSINIENHGGKASIQARDGSGGAMDLHLNPAGGNVGIGMTSPQTKLNVNKDFSAGSTQRDFLRLTASQPGAWFSQMGLQFRWNDFGNGAAWNLASVDGQVDGWSGSNGGGALVFYTKTLGPYATDPTEKMRINAAGALCLGTTTPYGTNLLNVNGSVYATGPMAAVISSDVDMFTFVNTGASYTKSCFVGSIAAAGSTSSYYFYGQQSTSSVSLKIFTNGNIQNTNNSYGAISDARLKENIKDATPKLEDLMKVKVRNYNLKGESNKQIGVISQELEEIFPNMIEESTNIGENVKIKGVKYSVFVPMLIKAIQEQQAQINELKSQLNK